MEKISLVNFSNPMDAIIYLRKKKNLHDLFFLILFSFFLSIHKVFPSIEKLPARDSVRFIVSTFAYAVCIQILFFIAQKYNTKSIMKAGVLVSGLGYSLYRLDLPVLAGFALGIGSSIIASVWFYSLIDTRLTNFFQSEINGDKPIHVRSFIKQINKWNESRTYRVMDTWSELLLGKVFREFENAIKTSINFKVEVLLANPYSKVIKQRSEDLKKDAFVPSEEGLSKLFDLCIRYGHKLDVRLYNTTISCRAYSSFDKTFFSFYPPRMQGDHAVNLEFFNASPLGEYVNSYFNQVWRSDKSIDINYHMKVCINPPVSGEWEQTQEFMYCIDGTTGVLYFFVRDRTNRLALEGMEKEKLLVNLLIDQTILEDFLCLSDKSNVQDISHIGCASLYRQIRKLDDSKPEDRIEEEIAIKLCRKRYGPVYLMGQDLDQDPTVFKASLKISDRNL
jgi:hypothetical protein